MKKLIGICFAICLFATLGMAQTTASTNATAKKSCTPTKECAAKMGMTLAECKKVCTGNAGANGETKVASAIVDIDDAATSTDPKKSKECAKKCTGKKVASAKDNKETQVASAVVTKEIEAKSTNKKECSKTCKKTCTKKAE